MSSEVKMAMVFKDQRAEQTVDNDLPDLEDKDVQDAATKIQAAFKGHKVRLAKKLKPDDDLPDLNDRGIQDAATKIQAAFKGHKVRKAHNVQDSDGAKKQP